ncbi:acyl transferase domain-containing protein [Streptomyces albogriseolus]
MSSTLRGAGRRDEPVAIVGMACLLPGAHTPDEFWEALLAGEDHRTEGRPGGLRDRPGRARWVG